jgi:hypothetical protein
VNVCRAGQEETGNQFPLDWHGRHSPECVIPDDVLIQFGPPDDERLLLEPCSGIKINTLRKSASSWSLPRIELSSEFALQNFYTCYPASTRYSAQRHGRSLSRPQHDLCLLLF